MQFEWFSEMNGVMRRQAVVNPPSLLDTSNLASPTPTTTQPDTIRTAEGKREPLTPSVSSSSTSRPNSVVIVTNESGSEQSLGQPIQPIFDQNTCVEDPQPPEVICQLTSLLPLWIHNQTAINVRYLHKVEQVPQQ